MNADKRSGALAVQVEVADEELFLRAPELLLVVGEHRAGQAVLSAVRDPQSIIEVLRFRDGEDRSENLFLRDRGVRRNIDDDRGLDEKAFVRLHVAPGDELPFLRALVDVLL